MPPNVHFHGSVSELILRSNTLKVFRIVDKLVFCTNIKDRQYYMGPEAVKRD